MERALIEDSEVIVRALKTPVHYDLKKKRLKPAAFRPPKGSSIISVARPHGVETCREQIRSQVSGNVIYSGLGAILAMDIRKAGSELEDAPEDFDGHAHIDHGIVMPIDGEPLPAELNLLFTTRLRDLASRTQAYLDPDPGNDTWQGEDLMPPR
ncbi:MAG: hypothetical protein ACKVK5_10510 [Pseudomonadales bacterium]